MRQSWEKRCKALKRTTRLSVIILLAIFVLVSCTQRDTAPQTNNSIQQEQSDTDKEVTALKSKYSAADFYTDDIKYSAEITDNYKEQTLYAPIISIDDVFYSGDDLFMYVAETWSNEHFLLKITPEQYSTIKTLHNDFLKFDLHIVFKLSNIEPMIPTLNADFYFDVKNSDDVLTDEESSLSFNSKIIRGELIDIIETQSQY